MDITLIECKTTGLYEWGRGMDGWKANRWDLFWRNYNRIFWKPCVTDNAIHLVSTYGGGMIHAMDFRIPVLRAPEDLKLELRELDTAMRELATDLKFGYTITVSSVSGCVTSTYATMSFEAPSTGVETASKPDTDKSAVGAMITAGIGPYRALIVDQYENTITWRSKGTYDTEDEAVTAVIAAAKNIHLKVEEFARHWITDDKHHMIDFGSHTYLGKVISEEIRK